MSNIKHKTREQWLLRAVQHLDREFFKANGYELPEKMQVSCGFAYRSSNKAIGQCHPSTSSKNGTIHIFICPSMHDIVQTLGVLLHEMIHAWDDCEHKHKGPFRKLAKEFGLAGKMTATYVEEGSELYDKMAAIATKLGDYPHDPLRKTRPRGSGGSGWIRLYSPEEPTFSVVVSPRKLEEFGVPLDPWGNEMGER